MELIPTHYEYYIKNNKFECLTFARPLNGELFFNLHKDAEKIRIIEIVQTLIKNEDKFLKDADLTLLKDMNLFIPYEKEEYFLNNPPQKNKTFVRQNKKSLKTENIEFIICCDDNKNKDLEIIKNGYVKHKIKCFKDILNVFTDIIKNKNRG